MFMVSAKSMLSAFVISKFFALNNHTLHSLRFPSSAAPDVVISDVRVEAHGAGASLTWGERSASLMLSMPGEHNVLNATAAWVAGIECGLEPQVIADGLGEFTGAARRFEAEAYHAEVPGLDYEWYLASI